jgi:flagellar basal body-associated protein FliL
MATEETAEPDAAKASGSKMGIVLWLVMIIVAVGGGVAAPILVAQMGSADKPEATENVLPSPDEEVVFIDFDEVTVNLDEARFSRYLRINFSLQVAKSQQLEVAKKVEAKKSILKNWLQVQVAEKSTDDLRGKFGRNRLRREMLDYFNKVLFSDGIERIQDVLFSEFHVQ